MPMPMPQYSNAVLDEREQIAESLLNAPSYGLKAVQADPTLPEALSMLPRDVKITFAGTAAPSVIKPNGTPTVASPLGHADVVVITYTQPEADALAHVLTPGVKWSDWLPYSHHYLEHYRAQVGPRGPSHNHNRLALVYRTAVQTAAGETKSVLVMKSDLHLHTDVTTGADGKPTIPIRDLYQQIVDEATPDVVLTIGTSGGVYPHMRLGDVVVTRGAAFHCYRNFKAYNHFGPFKSDWEIKTPDLDQATAIMKKYRGELMTKRPPEVHCTTEPNIEPTVYFDGRDKIPPFHPILTTDIFEYGTTQNKLYETGIAVEMDDAVLAMVCDQHPKKPKWAVVRNLSDPIINGDLDPKQQTKCAVFYYSNYGAWTSLNGALTTWSIIRGL